VLVQRPSTPGLGSAAGLLAALGEESLVQVQVHALRSLDLVADQFWAEIAGSVSAIEALCEDEAFPERELAAILAAKVFFHLGEFDDALSYALAAGSKFNVADGSDFVQTLLAKAIDQYIELRSAPPSEQGEQDIDPRLIEVVERMFQRCFDDGNHDQAIGIALESRRLDKLESAILASADVRSSLAYSTKVCQTTVSSREFRMEVLRVLVRLYETSGVEPDYVSVCQCLMFLEDPGGVAKVLHGLLEEGSDGVLQAYQVAFDLFENDIQPFLTAVRNGVRSLAPKPVAAPAPEASGGGGGDAMETEEAEEAAAPAPAPAAAAEDPVITARRDKLCSILSGDLPVELHLEFLFSRNKCDMQILKNIKASVEPRNSVCYSATILANALMHAGTTVDTFLRENLDWLSRATNWAKFSATAGLGVVHQGHLAQGQSLMQPYLPRGGSGGGVSPYSEGGALYALGLIYCSHGDTVRDFLQAALESTVDEAIQHGACLGLGLAALGSANEGVYQSMRNVQDSAVASEAAGIGMGLVYAGSCSDKMMELLQYAQETQHEKAIRGVGLGLALMVYGREEQADTLIEQMVGGADPILRYNGANAVAMAYRGTGNNGAIRRLLHMAVSDVSDDVRRTAVMALGYVLVNDPQQCPRLVALLAESYNPHVRYGAAMAVGIACSATGLKEAVSLLEPLVTDAVDFVRQGALIAMSLVLVQQPEAKVAPFRKQLDKFCSDKHEDTMCKMGAIMASGIIDAGGRNVTIGLRSRTGYHRMGAVVGMMVFSQYWFWYPLSFFISLAFTPTALIALNDDLKMPAFEVTSAAKPSTFAVAPPVGTGPAKEATKAPTAVLSTTAKAKKAKAKAEKDKAEKDKAAGGDAMETDEGAAEKPATTSASAADEEAKEKPAKTPEPSSEQLENPARVVPAQEKFIHFDAAGRYQPLKRVHAGIVMVKDTTPDQPVELVVTSASAAAAAAAPAAPVEDDEPAPPAPFAFTPDA